MKLTLKEIQRREKMHQRLVDYWRSRLLNKIRRERRAYTPPFRKL